MPFRVSSATLGSPAGFAREQVKSLGQNLDDRHPIGMVLVSDDANKEKQLVVLDHAKKKTPRLLIIGPVSGKTAAGQPAEVKLAEIELKDKAGKPIVVTPTAIVQDGESAGIFVIADACDDETEGASRCACAGQDREIRRWHPSGVRKLESCALEHEGNVLVYPTCLVARATGSYLVCDAGFKLSEFEYADIRTKAEPAGLYRVYLGRDGGTRVWPWPTAAA